MPRGCKPGERRGGKAKGTKNRATILKEAQVAQTQAQAIAAGITPLEVMLETMRSLWGDDKRLEACSIAKDAAPYIHPKLASVENAIKPGSGLKKFTLTIEGDGGDD